MRPYSGPSWQNLPHSKQLTLCCVILTDHAHVAQQSGCGRSRPPHCPPHPHSPLGPGSLGSGRGTDR